METRGQIFITIGDASGLGAGAARTLAEASGKVVIANLNGAAGTVLAQELGSRFVRCNVTSEADGQAVVEAATSLGTLRGLVSYAGTVTASRTMGKMGLYPLDQLICVININPIDTFNMIRLVATAMANSTSDAGGEHGVTISTASVAAFGEQIDQAAYVASRGGVAAMTLAIACDLSHNDIRVMTITPNIFETPILLGMPAEVRGALGKMAPFPPCLGKPSEYAQLARAIAEDPMFNGKTIRLGDVIRIQPKQAW